MGDISKEIAISAPTSGFSGAEYNAVATGAKLEGINLLASSFTINPEYLASQDEWKLSYSRKILSCQFLPEDNGVVAIFQFQVSGKHSRKNVMRCSADYGVFYGVPDGCTQEAAMGFCKNVGTFAAYPYFRALVGHLFAEARIHLPPLPSIASTAHIPPKPKPKELPDA